MTSGDEGNQLTIKLSIEEAGQLIQIMDMALRYNGINVIDVVSHLHYKLRIAKAVADSRIPVNTASQLLIPTKPKPLATEASSTLTLVDKTSLFKD